jgi:hypothetical protein
MEERKEGRKEKEEGRKGGRKERCEVEKEIIRTCVNSQEILLWNTSPSSVEIKILL